MPLNDLSKKETFSPLEFQSPVTFHLSGFLTSALVLSLHLSPHVDEHTSIALQILA